MTALVLRPGPISGSIRAPPSKSYTHRALVVGHLAHRPFRVRQPLDSDDTRATAVALGRLGTPVVRTEKMWEVRPGSLASSPRAVRIQCRESGTTLRLACALSALTERTVLITSADRLSERPIDELLRALMKLGGEARHVRGLRTPIAIRGPIRGGHVSLDVSRSSQFASALLLTLPTLDDDSVLELTGTIVSRPYIDATLAILRHHGIHLERKGRRFYIPGRQRPQGSGFTVPGDASSAAYLWVAAALSGGQVSVTGLPQKWPQADFAVLELLRLAGATVVRRTDGATVSPGRPRPFRVDLTDAPDLYPLAGVIAATIPAASYIFGAGHAVHKESDRKTATGRLARCLGAKVKVSSVGLRILGTSRPKAINLPALTDHRLVMSAAAGALAAGERSRVGEREAVRKSFPEFWSALATLSGGSSGR